MMLLIAVSSKLQYVPTNRGNKEKLTLPFLT